MSVAKLTKKKYSKLDRWINFFEKKQTLHDISYCPSWTILFSQLKANPKFNNINDKLKQEIERNHRIKIYPHPSHLFKAFSITSANNVKVVIIGQDPYFNHEVYKNRYVPQAMGLSFSVPQDIKIPSSLGNIYSNLLKFKHIKEKPTSGNLWFWAAQGCLMLNVALTVIDGKKKSHTNLWQWFTDYVIEYISTYMNDIIFVLWGGDAYKKISLIDLDKHHTIISSHPSGLSANKPFRTYPAFMNEDHFGKINEILESTNRTKIIWR